MKREWLISAFVVFVLAVWLGSWLLEDQHAQDTKIADTAHQEQPERVVPRARPAARTQDQATSAARLDFNVTVTRASEVFESRFGIANDCGPSKRHTWDQLSVRREP
jgi:hypothetical protein